MAWPEVVSGLYAGRCNGTQSLVHVSWRWAVYDTVDQVWFPPVGNWTIDDDTAWPNCVGNPINVGYPTGWNSTNQPFASVAAFHNQVAFVHDRSGSHGLGTRVSIHDYALVCSGGTQVPAPGPIYEAPDPCYNTAGCNFVDGGPGGNGPDGGVVVADEWGAVLSFLGPPAVPNQELLLTWYGMRDDTTFNNQFARVYGGVTGNIWGNPFLMMQPVAVGTPGQAVPWDHNLAPWWDYQAIGADATSNSFLAAWGGDARYGGPTAIWTARVFP